MIRAKKLKMVDMKDQSKKHDVGQVGDIVSIDPSVVKALQDDQFIPVISPRSALAPNNESSTTSMPTSWPASWPRCCKAEKLLLLTNTPGVLDKDGKLLTDLTPGDRRHVADGTLNGGMLPKIASAIDAAARA